MQIQDTAMTVYQNQEVNITSDDEQQYWDETDPVRYFILLKYTKILIYNRISFKKKEHSHFSSNFIQTLMQSLNPKSNSSWQHMFFNQ